MLRKSGVLSAVLLVVASGVAHADFTPSPEPGEQTTPIPAPAATPKSFRWVPYPGVPEGNGCGVQANSTGAALTDVRNAATHTTELWVARSGGARKLTYPPTNLEYVRSRSGHAISDTDIVVALAEPRYGDITSPTRLVRWDAAGTPTWSPPLPVFRSYYENWIQVLGVTPAGDAIVAQTAAYKQGTAGEFWVWRADGTLNRIVEADGFNGIGGVRYGLARDGSFVYSAYSWEESRYIPYLVRPNAGWKDVSVTRLHGLPLAHRSPDGQWWASEPRDGLGTAKGLNAPLVPTPGFPEPDYYATVLGINDQGTMLVNSRNMPLRWINGSRQMDVYPAVTRLPQGARLPTQYVDASFDNAGRIHTTITTAQNTCRVGVLAPEW